MTIIDVGDEFIARGDDFIDPRSPIAALIAALIAAGDDVDEV